MSENFLPKILRFLQQGIKIRAMKGMSRRHFVGLAGTAATVIATCGVSVKAAGRSRQKMRNIRVRPIYPQACSSSDLKFCQRAQFYTAADAIRAVAAREIEVEIYIYDLS